MHQLDVLQTKIEACTACEPELLLGAKPIFNFSTHSKIAIIGQAPGAVTHKHGIPFYDKSGIRLRQWLGVDEAAFYDSDRFAIVPMGFCYPGKGKSGDLPPRKECAPLWHEAVWSQASNIQLTILIGQYALKYYLGKNRKKNLTETVLHYEEYLPKFFPIVHPSPRNQLWLRRNPWFEDRIVPELQTRVAKLIG